MENHRIIENKIMFWTKCVVLILGLITAIPVANHLLRDVYKFVCVWGFLCVVYLFIKRRENYWTKEYLLLFLFCCSYMFTILLGSREHLASEIAMLGFTGVLFFVLTYCDRQMARNQIEQELKIISWIIVIISFVFSFIGFFMFAFSVSGKIVLFDNEYIYGMFENRLWGLYNPNTGSTINIISMISSLFLLKKADKHKYFLWFNIVIQTLCLILTQSRGTGVCFFTFVVVYLLSVKTYKNSLSPVWKMNLYKIAVVTVTVIVMIVGNVIVKNELAEVPSIINTVEGEQQKVPNTPDTSKHNLDRLDKKENNIQSISTGRSSLWKFGLDAFVEKPILGIGFRSIDDVLSDKMTESGYLNSASGGLHNVYITVLVSSGVIGFGIVALFILVMLRKIVKCLLNSKEQKCVKAICGFILAILVSELVESRILFGMNVWAFIFWIFIGYICFYDKKGEKIDNSNRASV